jgi:hypothetical protein
MIAMSIVSLPYGWLISIRKNRNTGRIAIVSIERMNQIPHR